MGRYRGEVPRPYTNVSGAPVTSPDYYVDVNGKADWHLTDLNVADESLKLTVLKTKLKKLQEACLRAVGTALLSVLYVLDFALGFFLAPVAGDIFSNNALGRTAEVFEVQI